MYIYIYINMIKKEQVMLCCHVLNDCTMNNMCIQCHNTK